MTNSQNENDILLWRNDNSATPRMIAKSLRIWHKKRNCQSSFFFWWRWKVAERARVTDHQNPSISPILPFFLVFLRGFLSFLNLLMGV